MNILKRNKGKIVVAGLVALLLGLLASDRIVFQRLPDAIDSGHSQLSKAMQRSGYIAYWPMDDVVLREPCNQNVPETKGTRRVIGVRGHARAFLPDERGMIDTRFPLNTLGSNFTFACHLLLPEQPTDQRIFQYLGIEDGAVVSNLPKQAKPLRWPITITNHFFHLALSVNGDKGTAGLFINGLPVATHKVRAVKHRADTLLFGQGHWLPPASFTLDECALWPRTLSDEDIATLGQSTRLPVKLNVKALRLGLGAAETLAAATHSLLLTGSMIDPRLGLRRITGSGLPLYDLALSRADIKHFNAFHNTQAANGLTGAEGSIGRGIGLNIEGKLHDARMAELSPRQNVAHGTAKPSFTLTLGSESVYAPRRTMLFRPPEESHFLLPVLAGELAARCALPVNAPELCAVFMNATPRGVYLSQPLYGARGETWIGDDDQGWRRMIAGLPLMEGDALQVFDDIVARNRWALYSDRRSPLTAREMAHTIRLQRRLLQDILGESVPRTDQALVDRVSARLTPDVLLNGNSFAGGVLHDLDLASKNINGATVDFRSLTPDVLVDSGHITPLDNACPAHIGVTIRSGAATATNILSVVVMGRHRALPLVELNVLGQPGLTAVPCELRLIEGHEKRIIVREGTLRVRGNSSIAKTTKRYYHLEFEEPHGLAGFSRSKHLFLTSAYRDPSLIRETLAYDLFRSFSKPGQPRYAPHVRLVEVALNNEYRGVYELTDRVDGNLLEYADSFWDADHPAVLYKAMGVYSSFCRLKPSAYVQKIPNWKDREFWGPYEEFISFIVDADIDTFAEEVELRIDVDNIIDHEILLNLTANWEGCNWGLYIARRSGPDQRFFLVPWDYDMTFYQAEFTLKNCLIKRLHRDLPSYNLRASERWQELRSGVLAGDALQERIGALEAQLSRGAAERNYQRWPLSPGETHTQHVEQLRAWIEARLVLLDQHFVAVPAP